MITVLAESGAGDQTIMDITGHVSHQMLARYSHIWMEAKRKALAEVDRQRAAENATRKKLGAQAQAQHHAATPASVTPKPHVQ